MEVLVYFGIGIVFSIIGNFFMFKKGLFLGKHEPIYGAEIDFLEVYILPSFFSLVFTIFWPIFIIVFTFYYLLVRPIDLIVSLQKDKEKE